MNAELGKGHSLIHGVSKNDKGKLIWTESYEALQMFVEEVLNITNGVWSSPGGAAKQLKTEDIDLRWYEDTKSITLNGKLKDEITAKLLSLAKISEELKTNTENEVPEDGGHTVDHIDDHSCIKDSMPLSLESLNSKLKVLINDVNANTAAIKLFSHDSEKERLRRDNVKLANENSDLKHENGKLKERVDNLNYILADLNGKAKNAEDEKNSLITAMRLLLEDNYKGNAMTMNHDDHPKDEIDQSCEEADLEW